MPTERPYCQSGSVAGASRRGSKALLLGSAPVAFVRVDVEVVGWHIECPEHGLLHELHVAGAGHSWPCGYGVFPPFSIGVPPLGFSAV